jgi:hypothetical protein
MADSENKMANRLITEKYFDKFPIIQYSNTEVVDITRRTTLLDTISKNPYNFYSYDISNAERADHLSYRYYKDSYFSWLIYLSNNIIDPYYEWFLDSEEFENFLIKKYGSIEESLRKVHHYQNDWEFKEKISISSYEALVDSQKKYWEPEYAFNNIKQYKRKEIDWKSNTNKVISYEVSSNSFIEGEVCKIVFNPEVEEFGKGEVTTISNNMIYINNVSGTFYTDDDVSVLPTSYIYGIESQTNTIFTDVSSVSNNISEEELVYWKEVTNYEYEYNKNQFNSTIRLIDSKFSRQAAEELNELMGN